MAQREEWSSAGTWAVLRERKWPCGEACFGQSAGPRDRAGELMAKASAPDLGPRGLKGLSSVPTPMMSEEHSTHAHLNVHGLNAAT